MTEDVWADSNRQGIKRRQRSEANDEAREIVRQVAEAVDQEDLVLARRRAQHWVAREDE